MRKATLIATTVLTAALVLAAQAPPPPGVQAIEVKTPDGAILSFRPRGTTTVELKGTERMPTASVTLKVESRPGFVEIDINRGAIKKLEPASRFGRDFLTYVLWTVSVDGAAMNVGEITFQAGRPQSINVTTPYQTFWMMVTAEPDYAVRDPSPVVVLVSQSQDKTPTSNKAHPVPGALSYYTNYAQYDTRPPESVSSAPFELRQAHKAVELASQAGILGRPSAEEEPLPGEARVRETFRLAQSFLGEAESEFEQEGASQRAIQFARTAAQIAENARALALGAVGGIQLRQLERELERARAREQDAHAERDRLEQELARLRDRFKQLEAALDRERGRTRELESQLLALQERIGLMEEMLQGVRGQNARLTEERDRICAELRRQLASLGQLTEQGGQLVLNLASDILFDFNRHDLRPAARERLAKLAVLRMMLFPDSPVRYIGHTDLVGEEDYNQWLSEQRASAVYRYFLQDQLAQTSEESEKQFLEERLRVVEELLQMNYNTARRQPDQRQELLTLVSDAVVGMGMREPVVPEQGPNEQNRRVSLLFPEPTVGALTSLCPAAPSTE
ncbi:MAG: OmpA family protein [Terriglobia bacterium]